MKLSLLQLNNLGDNEKNLEHALEMIEKAGSLGADFVVLPEMFSCPYKTSLFAVNAQEEGGTNWNKLSEAARKNKVYLVAGSMPELEVTRECCEHSENIYNTSYVFDRNGKQIAKHRKVHLFDVDIKGGQRFKESDSLTAGNSVTTFKTEFCIMGLMICFDIRFPEMARLMQLSGAEMIFVPAAFNMTSGPKWWELMFKTRAVDNQLFMAGCSPARDEKAEYKAWGHSIVNDPWGQTLGELDVQEDILNVDIDFDEVKRVRSQVPLTTSRRTDIYTLELNKPPQ